MRTSAEVVCVDGVDGVEAVIIRNTRTGRLSAVNASAFLSCESALESTLLMRTHPGLPDVIIRPARLDEHAVLESLQRRASLNNPGDRGALLANPDAIALPIEQIEQGCVFVAERDGIVAGFAAVVPRSDGGAELDALFVEPDLWKRGIGRRLIDYVAEVAGVRNASFLHVIGNPHAEGFYVSCGFRETGRVETRFGTGLDMRRPV